jgi:hypothetical protein
MKKEITHAERCKVLRKWIKDHDLFNIAALCRRINYDRGAFSHWLEEHENWDLSAEAADRLEAVLIDYGYKK